MTVVAGAEVRSGSGSSLTTSLTMSLATSFEGADELERQTNGLRTFQQESGSFPRKERSPELQSRNPTDPHSTYPFLHREVSPYFPPESTPRSGCA